MVCPPLFLLFMTSHITHNLQAHPLTEKGKKTAAKNAKRKYETNISIFSQMSRPWQGTYLKRA